MTSRARLERSATYPDSHTSDFKGIFFFSTSNSSFFDERSIDLHLFDGFFWFLVKSYSETLHAGFWLQSDSFSNLFSAIETWNSSRFQSVWLNLSCHWSFTYECRAPFCVGFLQAQRRGSFLSPISFCFRSGFFSMFCLRKRTLFVLKYVVSFLT